MTISTYYAVADANGPISVRIEAESIKAARDWFNDQDESFVDECRTDAEDDLGFRGEGMTYSEFAEVMEANGCELVDGNFDGNHNWALWVKS